MKGTQRPHGSTTNAVRIRIALVMVWAGCPTVAEAQFRPGQTHVIQQSVRGRKPSLGPSNAVVTIRLWSSFKLYHMTGIFAKLKEIIQSHPQKIRIVGLHRVRGYGDEDIISQIAREAFAQGGSELYWKVFEAFTNVPYVYALNVNVARKLAVKQGVNAALLEHAIRQGTHRETIEDETALMVQLGMTPTSYDIPLLIGTQLYSMRRYTLVRYMENTLKAEIAKAEKAMRSGVRQSKLDQWALGRAMRLARYRIYPYYGHRYRYPYHQAHLTMWKLGVGTSEPLRRYHVSVDNAPMLGNPVAPVTAVLFADLRNYLSGNAYNELKGIIKKYRGKVRLVVRVFPTAADHYSAWAARLVLAIDKKGKFWDLVDEMVRLRYQLMPSHLAFWANRAKLDVKELNKLIESPEIKQKLQKNAQMASRMGISNAPVVFINGRKISPVGQYDSRFFINAVIKEELKPGMLTRYLGETDGEPETSGAAKTK